MYLPLTFVDGQSKFDRSTNGVICIYPNLSSTSFNNTLAFNQTRSCVSMFSFGTSIYLIKFFEKIIDFFSLYPAAIVFNGKCYTIGIASIVLRRLICLGSYRNLFIRVRYKIDHACRLFHTSDILEHSERKKRLQIIS